MMPSTAHKKNDWFKWPFAIALGIVFLYFVFMIYSAGQALYAIGLLTLGSVGFYVYLSNTAFAYRYLFPGLAGMAVFVAFPLFYTVNIGLTNYSSNNLLSQERAASYLLDQSTPNDARTLAYSLHTEGDEFRIVLMPPHAAEDLNDPQKRNDLLSKTFVSPALALRKPQPPEKIQMLPYQQASFELSTALGLADLLKRRDVVRKLQLQLPDQSVLNYVGVREFGPLNPVWKSNPNGSLTLVETGELYTPNMDTGFFENAEGDRLQPGFKVNIGFKNFQRILTEQEFREPFIAIFLWTVAFAALTVLFSLIIGITLAVLLNWEALRFRTLYRTLLFLPYAVPGFISILVFKGLFNQNFGEINAILNALFGIKPAWFADPTLAKAMILIVNTWLGYPFIMVLCSGLIKAIPADLYEASAIAGAKPLTNFFKITAPLIVKPLMPLLISAFAFNFNNFVLISLLTDGRPDFLNTKVPAGTTDILVSYTYRIAFQDSGQNFGLAAAISTVIFIMVALLSLINLKLAKVNQEAK
jgi:maltose/maltodextrin transport system permease protein